MGQKGNRFRRDRFTNNTNLLVVSADKVSHDDGHDRVGDKLLQPCFNVAAKLLRRFPSCSFIVNKGG